MSIFDKAIHFSLIFICSISLVHANSIAQPSVLQPNILQANVLQDMQFLAGDQLKGRAAFTPELDNAADYIAKQFGAIGLKPLAGLNSFKQSFNLYQITPQEVTLKLNDALVSEDQVFAITAFERINWTDTNKLNVRYVSAKGELKTVMQTINREGKNALVLVDPAHQEIFERYKKYFSQGLTKFSTNSGASILVILSSQTKISQININVNSHIKSHRLTNVVGQLPGNSLKGESIIYSAHYDHIGMSDKDQKDQIYNGADDDASGTTAVINLARHFSIQKNNQRTLIFVAFTGEEIGGYGSQYFSKKIDIAQTKAMLNIEMIGKPSVYGAGKFWMTGFELSDLAQIMNESLKKSTSLEELIQKDPYPKQQLFYRSDNATLARLGVPAHSFSSAQIDKDTHYHNVSDELATINIESMTQIIRSLAKASEPLVNGTRTPTRLDTETIEQPGLIY